MMIANEANIDDETLALQLANSRRTAFNSAKLSLSDLTPGNVQRATAKIQLIWGDADLLAYPSPQARAAILQEIKPEIPMHLVPGGGHWVAYECAAEVNTLVLAFHGK
jgi:pimeloyl-ACP methyl ester carboxylesterase